MNHARRYALVLVILLLAPVLLLQGLANANILIGPARYLSGEFLALLAIGRTEVRQTGDSFVLRVPPQGARLARQAFAREPYAGDALFVLAVEKRQEGDLAGMNEVLDAAYALDKRNRNVGALQLEQAAASGDVARTFGIVERLSVLYPSLTENFVSPLVNALDREGAPALILGELRQEPVWASAFWNAVPADPVRAQRMNDIRRQTDFGTSPQSDGRLLTILVRNQLYARAFAFWEEISGGETHPLGFVAGSDYPPFGWQLTTTGSRSMTTRDGAAYDIYVQDDTSGELARQLVRLPAGRYTFSADILPAADAGQIEADLQCVDVDKPIGAAQSLDEPAGWSVGAGCETYWLILRGSAYDRRESLRARVSGMQFVSK